MKKNLKVLLSALMSTSLVVGGVVTGLVLHNNNNNIEEVDENGGIKVDNIMCRGVSVRQLSTSTNAQGQAVQTFNYAVTPANATNQEVTATVKYKDGTDCSAVMAVAVDASKKTISLTCKGEFAKQITLSVVSKANSSATATATVDYEKKIKSVTSKQITYKSGNKLTDSNFYNVIYSQYSKDKTYVFTKSITLDGVGEDNNNFDKYPGFTANFETLLKKIINDGYQATATDVWNLSSSNAYHSLLSSGSYVYGETEAYIDYDLSVDVTCTTTNTKYIDNVRSSISFYISSFDFSGRTVGVDSIALDQTGFVF